MAECIVCLSDFSNQKLVRCNDSQCNNALCPPCLTHFIDFSYKHKSVPTCPAKGCKGLFPIKSMTIEEQKKVAFCCLSYTLESNSDLVNSYNLLLRIRKDRLRFIKEKMPTAISFVAEITMKNKLNKLGKLTTNKNGKLRNCMNIMCTGKLSDYFICNLCDTTFCPDCEKVKSGNHSCTQEDVQSVIYLRNMVACPQCKTYIEKSEGCNHMTCIKCKYSFDMITGAPSSGSYNHPLDAYIDTNRLSMLDEHINKTDAPEKIKQLLVDLESRMPTTMGQQKLAKYATKYTTDDINDKYNDILINYYKIYIQEMKVKRFHIHMSNMERKLVKGELTLKEVSIIHDMYVK